MHILSCLWTSGGENKKEKKFCVWNSSRSPQLVAGWGGPQDTRSKVRAQTHTLTRTHSSSLMCAWYLSICNNVDQSRRLLIQNAAEKGPCVILNSTSCCDGVLSIRRYGNLQSISVRQPDTCIYTYCISSGDVSNGCPSSDRREYCCNLFYSGFVFQSRNLSIFIEPQTVHSRLSAVVCLADLSNSVNPRPTFYFCSEVLRIVVVHLTLKQKPAPT